MLEVTAEVVQRAGKALHEALGSIRNEPTPERWVDLINRLNNEENAERLKAVSAQLRSTDSDRAPRRAADG